MAIQPGNKTTPFQLQVCVKNDRRASSHGLFFADDPFKYVLPVTLCQIILAIAASRLLHFILRPLRTPSSICNILGGIVIGPSLFGRSKQIMGHLYPPRQAEFLATAAALSAVFFVFSSTLKMNISTSLRAAKGSWRFGLIPFLASFWVISFLFNLFGRHSFSGLDFDRSRVIMSIMLSLSNFPVVSQALSELNLLTSELGQIALSTSMINDITQWFILAGLSMMMVRNSKTSIEIFFSFWALVFFCVFVVRPAMIAVSRKTPPGKPVKESYIVTILVGVLAMAAITDSIGVNYLHGPLLLGAVMPNGPPLATTLVDKTEAIITQILLPLLYVFIGMHTDVSLITNWNEAFKLQVIIIASCLAKLLGCVITSLTYKIDIRHGLMLGLIINIKGIVELIVFNRWRKLEIVNLPIFSQLVISSMVMTAILTPLIEILYKPHTRLHLLYDHPRQMRMIQNSPEDTELCIICCVHSEANVRSTMAFLEACNSTRASPVCAYVVHLIELLGQSTPVFLRVDKHRRESESVSDTNPIMRAFDNYARNTRGPVTIQPYINVAPYKNMHEAVCHLAEDNFVPFLLIPFHENEQTPSSLIATAIRGLNLNFQAYAPCTVGILVDRYSQLRMVRSDYLFHVGIFFIGGFDDREALAMGSRMSERADMMVTLFRFVLHTKQTGFGKSESVQNNEAHEEEEKEEEETRIQRTLDECYIEEFKAKNIGNPKVSCHNILVENGEHVVEAIRALQGNYDLVMVGRKHEMEGLRDEEMLNFIENAELLGVFGDMLASVEFCNGMVPVLVTQCGVKQHDSGLQSKNLVRDFKSKINLEN